MNVTSAQPQRPTDATLSVTKAARLLGVHPNTIRAWSDQGRLRYYRINPRGDRRYRLGDLQRFLGAAAAGARRRLRRPDGAAAPARALARLAPAGSSLGIAPRLERAAAGSRAGPPWPPSARPRARPSASAICSSCRS